jgi:hypothetical protein
MTDTQTMRETFEKTTRLPLKRNMIYKDQYDDMATEDAWFCFQAAWTRKPAAQVAGAEPAAYFLRAENGLLCAPFTATIDQAEAAAKSHNVTLVPLFTHPAPEPDATKVVSVPVPWEGIAKGYKGGVATGGEHDGVETGRISLHYENYRTADAAFDLITNLIDAALAADRERT